jgi:hypothetical protein
MESKCLFYSKSVNATVPADLVRSILENIQLRKIIPNSRRKTNDAGTLEIAVEVSQREDFSVTSVM